MDRNAWLVFAAKAIRTFCYGFMAVLLPVYLATGQTVEAIPPLVAGDVPTADKNHIEWYVGTRYQDTGSIERQIPFTEIVYGMSHRQEVTFEIPYLSQEGRYGLGDATVGTKFLLLQESSQVPGLAASFEAKLANGNQEKGLGTGAIDYDLRLRSQKTWGWFTGILNGGYAWIGKPEVSGAPQDRRNVWFTAFAQEYEVTTKVKLLSEVYWRNSDEPGSSNRLAGDAGFKVRVLPSLSLHAAIGKSLREWNEGGPKLRVYGGFKYEFALFSSPKGKL